MKKIASRPVETVVHVRRFLLWPILNLAAVALYLLLASVLWPLPGEESLPGGPGDAFYWFFVIVPLRVIAVAANAGAFILFLRKRMWRDDPTSALMMITVAAIWVCAAVYDHERSLRSM